MVEPVHCTCGNYAVLSLKTTSACKYWLCGCPTGCVPSSSGETVAEAITNWNRYVARKTDWNKLAADARHAEWAVNRDVAQIGKLAAVVVRISEALANGNEATQAKGTE